MARVIVSSSALLKQLLPHLEAGAQRIEVRKDGLRGMLLSYTTCTELPMEGNWHGKNAVLDLPKLAAALRSIDCQPVTLDLHDGLPCKLFALRDRPPGPFEPEYPHGWEPVTFEL